MEITLRPEILATIGPVQLTNSLLTSFIVVFIAICFFAFISSNFKIYNPSKLQLMVEMLIESLSDLSKNILGDIKGKKLFSFVFTFFIFILISNWFGLLPTTQAIAIVHTQEITGNPAIDYRSEETSIGECVNTKECYLTANGVVIPESSVHVFRPPSSDLSFAIALALISVFVTNFLGFKYMKKGYLKKYINFSSPINFMVGILEIVSEFGKLISFSFRLFGNVFAGEILLAVITSVSFGIATLPFLGLEIFVGFIQAFVFFILTTIFISLAVTHEEH